MRTRRFAFEPDGGDEVSGTFIDAINEAHTVTLPTRYRVRLEKVTKIQYSSEQEQITWHLLSLAGRLLVSWLALDWRFYFGIFSGLSHLGHILETRRVTRRTMVRSDRELLDLLERFYRSAPIQMMNDE